MENPDMFNAATAPLSFHEFLERLKHPAAADLVKSIKSFILDFLKSPPSPKDGQSVQDFFSSTELAFRSHPLWVNASEEELESAGEGLEKYVMTKVFSRAFGPLPEDNEHDQRLSIKISRLQQFLRPEHLDIVPAQNETSWLLAQKELQKINSFKAPRDKLVCILNCCRVINNLLLNASLTKNDSPPGADDFLPVLIYVVVKANPPQLHSNLQYVQRYRHHSRLVSEAAYFYTNLVSAESFIDNLDATSLSMDEAEFEKKMQAATANFQSVHTPSFENLSSEGHEKPKSVVLSSKPKVASVNKGAESPVRKLQDSSTSKPISSPLDSAKLQTVLDTAVVEEEKKGQLGKYYPFIYAKAGDLRVGDIEKLLEQYKELVLKHIMLQKQVDVLKHSLTAKEIDERNIMDLQKTSINTANLGGDSPYIEGNEEMKEQSGVVDHSHTHNQEQSVVRQLAFENTAISSTSDMNILDQHPGGVEQLETNSGLKSGSHVDFLGESVEVSSASDMEDPKDGASSVLDSAVEAPNLDPSVVIHNAEESRLGADD